MVMIMGAGLLHGAGGTLRNTASSRVSPPVGRISTITYLPDPFIDVSGVADGNYILEPRGAPDGLLVEAWNGNNCASIRIRLKGMSSELAFGNGPGPECSAFHL